MEDVDEREEEGLGADVECVVFGTEIVPVLFYLLNSGDLWGFGEGAEIAEEQLGVHDDDITELDKYICLQYRGKEKEDKNCCYEYIVGVFSLAKESRL